MEARERRTEHPELGLTYIEYDDGTGDLVRWEDDDRADESESQSDETG